MFDEVRRRLRHAAPAAGELVANGNKSYEARAMDGLQVDTSTTTI